MNVTTHVPLRPGEAITRIRAMRARESMVYHVGQLGHDAAFDSELHRLQSAMLAAGTETGRRVYMDEQRNLRAEALVGLGLGSLTQRRLAAFTFEYIFTRAAQPGRAA